MWDYLIVTAANEQQSAAYRAQIQVRLRAGQLREVRTVLVIPDAGGRRVGSGGSTLQCIREALRRESETQGFGNDAAERILRGLRILIVHAGGDSRRLPAYSPCGKIFVPLPGEPIGGLTPTIFDRLAPAFLKLPKGAAGKGQIVVASGDALLLFDCADLDLSRDGITALGALVSPEAATRHGVFCANVNGSLRLYLQKPSVREQANAGAIDAQGTAVLDIGVMSMDAAAAANLLRAFGTAAARSAIEAHGIDLYREICCALGSDATFPHYLAATRSSGSKVEEPVLREFFDALRSIPCSVQALDHCGFLHFGSTAQLITSGMELAALDTLTIANELAPAAQISGDHCWVEGCHLRAALTLHRRSVVVGVDVERPFQLAEGSCLDVTPGFDRQGGTVWFVRCYGVDDTFKDPVMKGATFCGRKLTDWLRQAGVDHAHIWDAATPEEERTLWNARVFPAEKAPGDYLQWRWMFDVESATSEQKRSYLLADRYSSAEIAVRADHASFIERRSNLKPLPWKL